MIPHAENDKQNDEYDYDTEAKAVKWHHRILLSRWLKVALLALIAAVIAPMLIYHYVYYPSLDLPPSDGFSVGSCLVRRSARLMCGEGLVNSSELCHPQCCYDIDNGTCFHRYPSRFTYIMDNEEWSENTTLRSRISTSPFNFSDTLSSFSLSEIRLSIDEVSATYMSVAFYNPLLLTMEGGRIEEKNYTYQVNSPELNVVVSDILGNDIFNTIRGPIMAADNIWEISFKLTDEEMYGLGEIPLKEGMVKMIYSNSRGASGMPLIFARTNGTYHGVLLDILDPTEVAIRGENQIVVRSITNLGMKFHLLAGPQPKDIMADVTKIIGFKKQLQYWMLGAHICSDLSSSDAQTDLSDFLAAASNEKLPFESHCGASPVVFDDDVCGGSIQASLKAGATLVRNNKKRFIPHISPYISIYYEESNKTLADNSTEIIEHFNRITESDCLNITSEFDNLILKTADAKELYKGKVGNEVVVYPDYKDYDTPVIMRKLLDGTEINGAILENNWPLDESFKLVNETFKYLPYFSQNFEDAFNHTPQWNITRPNGVMYMYTHNEYGKNFAKTVGNLYNDSVPIWTSSQWMSGDIVNKQNVNTTWTNLQRELMEAALGGISGHWLWSSPVCGDTEHYDNVTNVRLCVKWYMAATYLPLIKIHSKSIPRDPLSFTGTNKNHIITALNRRLSLLPYFYTTLQQGPILRPMFYQFPESKNISNLKTQFSVGDDLLIVPDLLPRQTHVHVIMPPGDWYELWSGLHIDAEEGEAVTMTTTDADFLTLIRGGSILVMQKDVKETAEETRLRSQYSIIVALGRQNVTVNITDSGIEVTKNVTEYYADGKLYMNENMSLFFKSNDEEITITSKGEDFGTFCDSEKAVWADSIKQISVYGLNEDLNNYDNHKEIVNLINLCDLKDKVEIIVKLN